MALFPIYGVFKGDFVPHLVAVDTDDPMTVVADKIADHSVGRRIAVDSAAKGYEVSIDGEPIAASNTMGQVLAERQLAPLHWVVVGWRY